MFIWTGGWVDIRFYRGHLTLVFSGSHALFWMDTSTAGATLLRKNLPSLFASTSAALSIFGRTIQNDRLGFLNFEKKGAREMAYAGPTLQLFRVGLVLPRPLEDISHFVFFPPQRSTAVWEQDQIEKHLDVLQKELEEVKDLLEAISVQRQQPP